MNAVAANRPSQALFLVCLMLLAGCASDSPREDGPKPSTVRTGADRILEEPYRSWIAGQRVGLVTNQTGVDAQLRPTAVRLQEAADIDLTTVLGPEHGFMGNAQAGEEVPSRPGTPAGGNQAGEPAQDASEGASGGGGGEREPSGSARQGAAAQPASRATATPRPPPAIYSLYGEHRAPSAEMLREVDVLVYDIQDLGVRFYTYISTLAECLRAAAREGIPFIVLDRPAPLNGETIQGPMLEEDQKSFVGIHPLPVRYGLTPGELARLLVAELQLQVDLRVVPLEGWTRRTWYDQTGLQWIAPSPNMPTLDTATAYPGLCLIEGTNLSEGRGTTRPFEWVGAPWLDAPVLVESLNGLGLPGVRFRAQSFQPTFSKYAGERCRGVQVHVTDRDQFDPLSAALNLIAQVRRLHPDRLAFRESHFDRLIGTSAVRPLLQSGTPPAQIMDSWDSTPQSFSDRRRPHLLY